MSRGRKLLIVGLVLALGIGLAWPFRKTTADKRFVSVARSPVVGVNQSKIAAAPQRTNKTAPLTSPAPPIVAKMTSTRDIGAAGHSTSPTASFDLANHPALSSSLTATSAPRVVSPVTPPFPPAVQAPQAGYRPAKVQEYPSDARPAYATTNRERAVHAREQRKAEVRHVVQNSDTLEKLAKRYLGSEDRALEIFDLNRDVLDNPHLLPIDAELRIPGDARKPND